MFRKPTTPIPSEALVNEWRRLVVCEECGDGEGGTLGERTQRAMHRRIRIRVVESMLLERMWDAPTVQP